MSKQKFTVEISGQNDEPERKLAAAMVLIGKLSTKEIEKLAHIVKNDPVKTAMAKSALGV